MRFYLNNSRSRLHLQIRDRIKDMVVRAGLRRGEMLPRYLDLCRRFHVSLVTIQRAMDELSKEGLVASIPGKGTFLTKDFDAVPRQLAQLAMIFPATRLELFRSPYLMEIFQGILLEADPLGVDIRLLSLRDFRGQLSPAAVADVGVDAVVLIEVINDDYIRQFLQAEIPMVVLDYASESVPVEFIACDNAAAARRAVDHLVDLGHRRIAYVDGWGRDPVAGRGVGRASSDTRERGEGYRQAMEARGLGECVKVYSDPPAAERLLQTVADDLAAGGMETPTGLVCYDSTRARLMVAALQARGLSVPRDVSLVAIAGASCDALGDPPVAYNRMAFAEMGRQAVRLLVDRCRLRHGGPTKIRRIGSEFVAGRTTAPPRP